MRNQTFYKILTSDFRPPIQGGKPLLDGKTFPFELPKTDLDIGKKECSYGWNFVDDLTTGIKIAGLWKTCRPNQFLVVRPSLDKICRGNKWRSSGLIVERLCTVEEINGGIERFSLVFGAHAKDMAREQILWFEALGRPLHDLTKATEGLEIALKTRGLDWKLKQFDTAWDARDARDARDAWAARGAWGAWGAWAARAARDAWTARDAWAAWAAWAARAARDAWDAWDAQDARAAQDAWAARYARDALDALTVNFASYKKWIEYPPDLLTKGYRDALLNGVEIALPTGPNELGFAMKEG